MLSDESDCGRQHVWHNTCRKKLQGGDGLKERIQLLIQREDPKNPLTDEQIATQLGIRRDEVTTIRHELGIPDSRKRRYPLLQKELKALLEQYPDISNRELTRKLQQKGFPISRFTIVNMRKEMQTLTTGFHAAPAHSGKRRGGIQPTALFPTFATMIGAQGTLKSAILQAQAAVLYPPTGLHTLLFGPTGVGKSRMAEAMYHFAVEQNVLKKNAPFVVFNCADYAKNPQLLLAQLFGYVKGAFTGADREKEGLVDRANGGILFLDEIHRLPPEGQENLFYLIDKNKYRRLGEVDFQRHARLLIIGATTESPESSLLLTFRRRIPMTIELPPLVEWSPQERLALIFHFFHEECSRIGHEVVVEREVVGTLLDYECPGNTGQLHSDIRVLMARSFLKTLRGEQRQHVVVERDDLPPHVLSSLQPEHGNSRWPLLKKERYRFAPGQPAADVELEEKDLGVPRLYEWIAERYRILKDQGQNDELIQLILNRELDYQVEKVLRDDGGLEGRLQQLANLVGDQIVQTVEQMLWIAEKHLAVDHHRLAYVLAIHLKGILDRLAAGEALLASASAQLEPDAVEYTVAQEMGKVIDTMLGLQLPPSELALIAMYLTQCRSPSTPKRTVGVVVASYGQVAKSMVDVAHRLFQKRYAIAVELSWDDDPQQSIERIGQALRQADRGAGVILLTDIGAQLLREEQWRAEVGVHTRVISPLTTSLVVEVIRKCMYTDLDLDQLVREVGRNADPAVLPLSSVNKQAAVVCVCLTGEGAARRLTRLLREKLGANGESLVYLQGSSHSIRKLYREWVKEYAILAVVGTVDPMMEGVPFVSFSEIVDGSGLLFLKRLALIQQERGAGQVKSSLHLADLLHPERIHAFPKVGTKQEVIQLLASTLRQHGCVRDDFEQKVWEREQLGSTHLAGMVAIPHAWPEQTIRPAAAIAILEEPIAWEEGVSINCVVMLAINERCQPAIEELYECLHRAEFAQLAQAKDADQLLHWLRNTTMHPK